MLKMPHLVVDVDGLVALYHSGIDDCEDGWQSILPGQKVGLLIAGFRDI